MHAPTLTLSPITVTGAVDDSLPLTESVRAMCRLTVDWYLQSGFRPPWISYLAQCDGVWVGTCAFKGEPRDGRVEIAYHTFPEFEGQGVATAMARKLVELTLQTESQLTVKAQTLPAESASTSLLKKVGFRRCRTVEHPEDGPVWEWEYQRDA